MKQLGFFIDASKCTGCKTCTVACKDAHDSPVGINFRHVLEYAGGGWRQDRSTGAWHQDVFAYYLSIGCNHCADPACVKVCPTKAHYKRKEDGLVVIDAAKCIGCGMCAAAVPAVFQIQGRVSVVQAQPRTPAEEAGAFDAANGCPVNAIRARKA